MNKTVFWVVVVVLAVLAGYFLLWPVYFVDYKPTPTLTPTSSTVNSFDSCAAAGYPIMESYPERCRTPDGLVFVKPQGFCIQVITKAWDPKIKIIREFPTPCDIPQGWEKVE